MLGAWTVVVHGAEQRGGRRRAQVTEGAGQHFPSLLNVLGTLRFLQLLFQIAQTERTNAASLSSLYSMYQTLSRAELS